MEVQRLFLAIEVPDEIKNQIVKHRETLGLPLKWIPEKNLHITVLFLGNVSVNDIPGLQQRLKDLYQSFHIFTLEAVSLIQKSNRFQSMIWASFNPSTQFESLATESAKSLGYKQERKPLPHINLVRSKKKIITDKIPLKLIGPMEFQVKEIQLVQSVLHPQGPTYSVLESFTLKA